MISATKRVIKLRDYYLNNAPMSIDRSLVCWKCHRSLYYYNEGWIKNAHALTVKIRRAMAEAYMLRNLAPVICPGELIVGQPDFRPFSAEEQARYDEYRRIDSIIPQKRGRADHLAPDYRLLLDKGIKGIIDMLKEKLSELDVADGSCMERYEYYQCCIIELEGLLNLAEHYASRAQELADLADGSEKEDYKRLTDILRQVPAGPARTFREALQSIQLFTYSLYGLYSFGHVDRYLLPYYRCDLNKGILTADEAQELIDCFFLQSIPNMSAWAAEGLMLGGRDSGGNSIENELTWHFLTAIDHTHIPDPNVGFCVTSDTGEKILRFAAELITAGHCQPQIWNSDAVTASMLRNEFDRDASSNFTMSTCVEVTPVGCSGISITSPYINLLKIFLDALLDCPSNTGFEDLFETFQKRFSLYVCDVMISENLQQLERGRNCTDPMRVSVLIHDCIERGMSNDSGGARYNLLEPNILGMSNTIESLNVIREMVYRRKLLTLDEFRQALADNYEGHEQLLSVIRSRIKHFGTGTPETNALAKQVADMVLDAFVPMTTVRGGKVIPGAFSYRDHEIQGRSTPASPDGRTAGMPLNDGSCPVQGYDNLGPTLSLASTTAWQPVRFLGGTSVNVKLAHDVLPETVVGLINGYLATEGAQLQFNVVNTDELLDAQEHPERYGDLLVRIGGYSDFFVKLPRSLQDEVISRARNEG